MFYALVYLITDQKGTPYKPFGFKSVLVAADFAQVFDQTMHETGA